MKTPLMTEVFVVREANVTTLAQMNKIPVQIAQLVNDFNRKHADVLAKVIGRRYQKSWSQIVQQQKDGIQNTRLGNMSQFVERFLQTTGTDIIKLLEKNPKKKAELVQHFLDIFDSQTDAESANSYMNDLKARFLSTDVEELRKRAEMTFPDGFFWVKLEGDECGVEGGKMQHCGQALGTMYSLRDPKGEPHVTVDVAEKGSSAWDQTIAYLQLQDHHVSRWDGLAIQVRGKQNEPPDRKYWNHTKQFMKKMNLAYSDTQALDPEFDKFLGAD